MFLRLVADSFTRRPRRKVLTTAALSVSLDVGDRLAQEFRSLGANLLVTPEADSLPLEIGGVDYRPANAGAYLPEADLGKLKTIFWRFNIMAFAPILDVPIEAWSPASRIWSNSGVADKTTLVGTWSQHPVAVPDGTTYVTGIERTNPWWTVEGKWFDEGSDQCLVGSAFAKKLGLKTGDLLNIYSADRLSSRPVFLPTHFQPGIAPTLRQTTSLPQSTTGSFARFRSRTSCRREPRPNVETRFRPESFYRQPRNSTRPLKRETRPQLAGRELARRP